ncbi:MAG: protein kinase [Gemmatimonadota bacterium]
MIDIPSRLQTALEGRYRLEGMVGEGGMASVFLAEDLKHERKVAIKVLKPELSAAVGADRFLAEIKTTANLQHAHILPLFDSGDADGLLFYVMPYVADESLRERLEREQQLRVEEAVRIAREVAEALDHAHRHDVIHRDIKPGNILLQDGGALVTDFGIALAVSAGAGGRLTETGLSVGTPQYMSPEQATGDHAVGPGTDVYSLGCALYEMLTGRPPFQGTTVPAVMGRLLADEAVPPRTLRPSTPLNVDAAIRRAIEKIPADRFASAHDFAEALADPSFRHGPTSEEGRPRAGTWRPAALAGWTLAAILGVGFARSVLRPPEPGGVEFLPIDTSEYWTRSAHLDISADGTTLVFRGLGDDDGVARLYVKWPEVRDPVPIPGTTNAYYPAIHPDGERVAFIAEGRLVVADLRGGPDETLTDSARCCPAWADDGSIYVTMAGGTTARVLDGVVERIVEPGPEGEADLWFLPVPGSDGGVVSTQGDPPRLEAISFSTGTRRLLTPGSRPFLLPSGDLLFGTSEGRLMVAGFDPADLSLTGLPTSVMDSVQVAGNESPFFTLSESGTLVYWHEATSGAPVEFVWASRSGEIEPAWPGWIVDVGQADAGWGLSGDGRSLAVKILSDTGADIWIRELAGGPPRRLTTAPGEDRYPRFIRGDEQVSFTTARNGGLDVFVIPADFSGPAEPLLDNEMMFTEAVWSPDGEWLIVRTAGTAGAAGGRDIWGLRPAEDSALIPLVVTGFDESAPSVSSGGNWLTYVSNRTGRQEVFVRPFPETDGPEVQVSGGGGHSPLWSRTGDELFYVSVQGGSAGGRALMVASFEPGASMRVTRRRLFDIPEEIYLSSVTTKYDVAPDDQRFLMARRVAQGGGGNQLVIGRNFVEHVRRQTGR